MHIKTNLSAVNATVFLLIIASHALKVNKTAKDIYTTIAGKSADKADASTLIGNIFLLSSPAPCVLTF